MDPAEVVCDGRWWAGAGVAGDPELSAVTRHLATHKYHAACKPSVITFAHQIDIPPLPQYIELPASANCDIAGEFELDARRCRSATSPASR